MDEIEVIAVIETTEIEVTAEIENLVIGSTGGGNVDIIDDVTSTVIASVTAPGTYHVLQFSGIDGGAANTVFTNSIVSP